MSTSYETYLEVCKVATQSRNAFNGFKHNKRYRKILEHVSKEQGDEYYNIIEKEYPELFKDALFNMFLENDQVGQPRQYMYGGRMISPTTLRYIKVLGDLLSTFDLNNADIIEIGGGYGGQAKIIHDAVKVKSYTIVDLPEALGLAGKYLNRFFIEPILKTPDDIFREHYDLCISNYAFTEIERIYQERYAEEIIKKSDKGYITCNFFDKRFGMSREEVKALRSKHWRLPERPLTAPDNFIYLWDLTK